MAKHKGRLAIDQEQSHARNALIIAIAPMQGRISGMRCVFCISPKRAEKKLATQTACPASRAESLFSRRRPSILARISRFCSIQSRGCICRGSCRPLSRKRDAYFTGPLNVRCICFSKDNGECCRFSYSAMVLLEITVNVEISCNPPWKLFLLFKTALIF